MENQSQGIFNRIPRLLLLGLIVLAAHGLCLVATYYLDDYYFVVDGSGYGAPRWTIHFLGWKILDGGENPTYETGINALLPGLIFTLNYHFFGPSPLASHLWNLGLHFLVVLAANATLRNFLENLLPNNKITAEKLAFYAAALVACHPMGSEAVNYAKCVYMQLVALFALLSCHRMLLLLREPSLRNALLLGGVCLLGFLSYHYGLPIIVGQLLILSLVIGRNHLATFWHKLTALKLSRKLCLTAALGLFIALVLRIWGHNLAGVFTNEKYGADWHYLTQGRIFWFYAVRFLIPVGLSSDHFHPWTTSWLHWPSTVGLLALFFMAGWLFWKSLSLKSGQLRLIAIAASIALVPFLLRFLHVNPEIMVEYRSYPALPWICLLLAFGIQKLAFHAPKFHQFPRWIVLLFVLLSAKRSSQWSSHHANCSDVLAQYPMNNRAAAHLLYHWAEKRDGSAMDETYAQMRRNRALLQDWNDTHPHQKYDGYRADENMAIADAHMMAAKVWREGIPEAISAYATTLDRWKIENPHFFEDRPHSPSLKPLLDNARKKFDPAFARATQN